MEEKRYNFARATEKKIVFIIEIAFLPDPPWASKSVEHEKNERTREKIFSSRVSLRETDAGLKFESIVRDPIRHSWGCQVLAGFLPSWERYNLPSEGPNIENSLIYGLGSDTV